MLPSFSTSYPACHIQLFNPAENTHQLFDNRPHSHNQPMASLTMMASFMAGAAVADRPTFNRRRNFVVAKAASKVECEDVAKRGVDGNEDGASGGRRAAMLAVAAAAVTTIVSLNGIAIAGDVPKAGTPEARKFYAPVCVTMPTAKACHK